MSFLDTQMHINDNFAKFSEALFVADRHAREEVRERALMQQRLVEKEKASKEEHLRMLAQRAREERGGMVAAPKALAPAAASGSAIKSSLTAYDSEDTGNESERSEGDEEARKVRDQMRMEKRREREREMRMNNMGTEQRAKMLAR